jgi:WD40 repeat protein/tRNA A-37 threonylcarbamoyl transferase component Bud32
MAMVSENKCRECGAVIPSGSPDGLCGKCLLSLGLEAAQGVLEATALDADAEAQAQADRLAGDSIEPSLPAPGPVKTVVVNPSPAEEPGDKIGRYKLLEKIGEGGFGAVYLAEQKEPVKRRVALKIIKLGMDTRQVVARFEAERQAVALMDHANIAKIFDAGATASGRPYFVMELVRGPPITQYCDANHLPPAKRLGLFIQVCRAIQHAHQKGLIHRDIKPSNILVTLHDGVPVPKVIDFGIAKATQADLTDKTVYTQFQQFIGTPAYMSPEQAEMSGLDIDTRSDIYSLGVLLYELLVGATPFNPRDLLAAGLDEMRRTIRETEPIRPSTRLRSLAGEELTRTAERRGADAPKLIGLLRGDLDCIVMKCLEKDRTRRYETANGLARDIERHLDNEPVAARPPSAAYRLQKFVRRNRLVFTAATAVGLALVLGVLVSSWQAIRATQAGRKEAAARVRAGEAARVADNEKERAEKEARRAKASELTARQNLYASDMLLAQRAREEGNLGLTLDLLNRHRPASGETDLRGWEWRYFWSVCQSDEVATFATNSAAIGQLVLSPDGSLLSTAEWGPARTAVKIWSFPSGRLFATPETDDAAGSVAFSPNGKLLAFGTRSHGLKVWDIETHQEKTSFPGRYGQYRGSVLLFSPDGTTLAAASGDEILLWNIEEKTLSMTLKGHWAGVTSLVFSPDCKTLISGSLDNSIRLWSLESRQEMASLNHTSSVASLALSADGKTLASGAVDKTIRIWDLETRLQLAMLTNHTRGVVCLALSPDQKTLASGSWDFLIKLWDTARWQEISTLRGSLDELYAIAFSPGGKTLVSGAKNGVIKTWNPVPQVRPPDVLERPRDGSAWQLDDGTLFCAHTNKAISCWDPSTLRQTAQYDAPEGSITNSVFRRATPGGKMVWATKQSEVVVWDMVARRQLGRLPWVPAEQKSVTVSPNEKLLVAVAAGKCLTVWDLEKLQEIATLPKSANLPWVMAFAGDLHLIAAGNGNGTVEVWDLSRKERAADWQAHQEPVTGVAFMPDGKRLVTVSHDAAAKLWDIETRRELRSLSRAFNAFESVAISPDGRRITAGTADGLIKMWVSSTGQEIAALRAGRGFVLDLQFLGPDGNTLVSLTGDGKVRLWRAPSWAEIAAAQKTTEGETR